MDEIPHADAPTEHAASVTARQREVLALVALGHTSKEIAALLAISKRTVDMHRAQGKRSIGARSLPEIVRWARENDLFHPRES